MAEIEINVNGRNKEEQYKNLLPQINALFDADTDSIVNMSNISSALKFAFNFFWVGFYRVVGDELWLGPFQGTIACTRIKYGKGVCGTAWERKETIIVPDVDKFPGHIACSSASKSEIVVPVFVKNEIVAVLDIDSDSLNAFDEIDAKYLMLICNLFDREYL